MTSNAWFLEDIIDGPAFVGLLGKAFYELPSQMGGEYSWWDYDDGDGEDTDAYSYTFNSNGTVTWDNGSDHTYFMTF